MSSITRLLRSGFICEIFSLVLFGSASSQAEIMFSDKLVWGRLSGLSGGSHNGLWDNEPVDQSYGPSEGFSELGAGFFGRGYGIGAFFFRFTDDDLQPVCERRAAVPRDWDGYAVRLQNGDT